MEYCGTTRYVCLNNCNEIKVLSSIAYESFELSFAVRMIVVIGSSLSSFDPISLTFLIQTIGVPNFFDSQYREAYPKQCLDQFFNCLMLGHRYQSALLV